jgi:hypothetical protein
MTALGIELDAGYAQVAEHRIANDIPLFAEVA